MLSLVPSVLYFLASEAATILSPANDPLLQFFMLQVTPVTPAPKMISPLAWVT
jgi:hypothetical protein